MGTANECTRKQGRSRETTYQRRMDGKGTKESRELAKTLSAVVAQRIIADRIHSFMRAISTIAKVYLFTLQVSKLKSNSDMVLTVRETVNTS